MRKFWDPVVKPLLEAAGARRVIEIGSEAGDHTQRIARWCQRRGVRLDVIDPKPEFEVETFAERFAGAHLHLALSLEVLADLLPADVVLIDGDHNWYTVFNEIRVCYGEAAALPASAPILVCHDVGWPYGRRDLYYDINTIPADARHPAEVGPLSPYSKGIADFGINGMLLHATHEGGPRNGVRTAIEDALAGVHDQVRVVWLSAFFGLAIIVPVERLEAAPALVALLDALELPSAWKVLVNTLEQERIALASTPRAPTQFASRLADSSGLRSFDSSLGSSVLKPMFQGVATYQYRGRDMLLNPFDMANYTRLIGDTRPLTVFEIGSWAGGRAVWLADTLQVHGVDSRVISVDLEPVTDLADPRITFLQGDALQLDNALDATLLELPHPWLVIEDSAHTLEASQAVMRFFDPLLRSGDYLVVEDGVGPQVLGRVPPGTLAPASQAIAEFLARRGADYVIDTDLCDQFGYNATFNPNGWLRRL